MTVPVAQLIERQDPAAMIVRADRAYDRAVAEGDERARMRAMSLRAAAVAELRKRQRPEIATTGGGDAA